MKVMSYTVHKHNADGSYSGESFEVDEKIYKYSPVDPNKTGMHDPHYFTGESFVVGKIKAQRIEISTDQIKKTIKTKKGPRRKRVQVVLRREFWLVSDELNFN